MYDVLHSAESLLDYWLHKFIGSWKDVDLLQFLNIKIYEDRFTVI